MDNISLKKPLFKYQHENLKVRTLHFLFDMEGCGFVSMRACLDSVRQIEVKIAGERGKQVGGLF